MAPAMHSAKYLFSVLQHVLTDQCTDRIWLNNLVKRSLHDWHQLANDMASMPIPLANLVPTAPHILGATDASMAGMGGFWVPSKPGLATPTLWRAPFPTVIQQALFSHTNPTGRITNKSDLELAAVVTGAHLAAPRHTLAPTHIVTTTDNTPALAWSTKGSTSSTAAPAFLLHHLAKSACSQNFVLHTLFTPGHANAIADFCSRSFHLPDSAFLTTAQQLFPVQPSWTLVHPSSYWMLQTNSSIFRKMPPWGLQQGEQEPSTPHGESGWTSALPYTRTHICERIATPFPSCASSHTDIELASSVPAVLRYVHEQWKAPYAPLARRWPHWAATIPGSYPLVT
jgi:hypothetical protein